MAVLTHLRLPLQQSPYSTNQGTQFANSFFKAEETHEDCLGSILKVLMPGLIFRDHHSIGQKKSLGIWIFFFFKALGDSMEH